MYSSYRKGAGEHAYTYGLIYICILKRLCNYNAFVFLCARRRTYMGMPGKVVTTTRALRVEYLLNPRIVTIQNCILVFDVSSFV